jgi:HAD superfamily hydrolase (TIGR01549 family)/HAD superfamily hydrolase (TIGR01509 family)
MEHLDEIILPGVVGRYFQYVETSGMTIRAVFFDMGGTIETYGWTPELRLQETAGIRRRLGRAGISLGLTDKQLYEIISAGLDAYHQVSLQTMDELPPQRVWNEYIFAGYPVDPEILTPIAEDLMVFIETRWFQRSMRPEVPGVLEAIRKMGLKIGLISNVNSRGQVPANLDLYGIRQYFNPIVLSSEYGRRKPDPAIFHYAARLANVPTGECVYIGDRIARDIIGARKAGYRLAVQICHDFEHGEDDSGATPDAVIDQMTEILEILRTELNDSMDPKSEKGSQNPIRALLFDAGDILYYRQNNSNKLAAFLKEIGLPYKEFPLAKRNPLRDKAYQGLINYDQYQEIILRFYGITRPGEIARGKQILDEEANNVQFFEGVPETLSSLKEEGYLLGIITDTALPVHVKLNWFERWGFGNVWDSVVSSRELGIRKPNPKIYQVALQQLGVTADQSVFVGHKSSELDGAKAVGIKTIAFNYEEGVAADYYLKHFSDLLKITQLVKSASIKQV